MRFKVFIPAMLAFALVAPPMCAAAATPTDHYSIKDYGAVGNGTTDDTAAFVAALAAVPNGGTLDLGMAGNTYLLKQTLVITKSIRIVGGSRYYPVLLFAADGAYLAAPYKCGLLFVANTTVVPGYAGGLSKGSMLSGFKLQMAKGPADMSGIIAATSINCEELYAYGFSQDGFAVTGNAASVQGNANGFRFDRCVSDANSRHGFYFAGTDANVGTLVGCTAIGNHGYGFYDASMYGQAYIGCWTDSNTSAFCTTTATNQSVFIGCYNEGGQSPEWNVTARTLRLNPAGDAGDNTKQGGVVVSAIGSAYTSTSRAYMVGSAVFAADYSTACGSFHERGFDRYRLPASRERNQIRPQRERTDSSSARQHHQLDGHHQCRYMCYLLRQVGVSH